MVVNEKSWHFRVALFGNLDRDSTKIYADNGCEYGQSILKGLFFIFLSVLLGVGLGICILEPFLALTMWLTHDNPFSEYFVFGNEIMVIEAIILFAGTGMYALIKIGKWIEKFRKQLNKKAENTTVYVSTTDLLESIYESWKHKFCPLIEFQDPDKNYEYHIAVYDRNTRSVTYDEQLCIAVVTRAEYSATQQTGYCWTDEEYNEETNTMEFTKPVSQDVYDTFMKKRFSS